MSQANNSQPAIERHLEREYTKSYTRRRHAHDLINKTFTAHITVFLAVLAASGYLYYKSEPSFEDEVRVLVIAINFGAIAVGIIFYLAIINIHISRDYYRGREKILYKALSKCLESESGKKQLPEVLDLLKKYESFSRFNLIDWGKNRSRIKWNSNWKSIFKMYRMCTYVSNIMLTIILLMSTSTAIQSSGYFNCFYINPIIMGVTITLVVLFLQYLLGRHYKRMYLLSHMKKDGKCFDTPGHLEDNWFTT